MALQDIISRFDSSLSKKQTEQTELNTDTKAPMEPIYGKNIKGEWSNLTDKDTPLLGPYMPYIKDRGGMYIDEKGVLYTKTPFPNRNDIPDNFKPYTPGKLEYTPRTKNEAVELNNATANPQPNPFPNMSPEELEVYKSLDANKPVLEQLYRKTVQKPKEISEKGMKAAQTASHIGNSLGILAEMFGASQGARISPRQSNLVENQIATERAIRAQNEAENNQYESGLLNAQAGDAQQKAQNEREKRAYMVNLVKQRKAEEQQAAKDMLSYQKWLAEMGLKQSAENRRKYEADRKYKLDVVKANKPATGSSTEPKFTGIVINARPDDPQAQQDASGNKVIKYDMTKEEVSNVANKAKRDTAFLNRHPELYVTSKNPLTLEVTRGLTKDDEIAWTYLQEQYDNRAPAQQQTQQQNTVNTNIQRQGGTSRAR